MSERKKTIRRRFLQSSLGVTATAALGARPSKRVIEPPGNGIPYGTIGDHKVSRLILGSNVPGAHSRDLIYVSQLGRAYNTKERMLDTYALAEAQGINTLMQGNNALIREYNATRGGNLRKIQPVNVSESDTRETIKKTLVEAMRVDVASLFYIWGDRGDYLVRAKRMDLVGVAMEIANELGMTLGLGGHSLQVPIQCEAAGIKPHFYAKTFHHDNYWSATPKENREDFCWYDKKGGNSYSGKTGDHDRFHDNIWCLDAEKTIEVMKNIKAPWIAFKVLAAGAIPPSSGFKFALENGADFVAVGMCDFHVKPNTQIIKSLLARGLRRERPWRA